MSFQAPTMRQRRITQVFPSTSTKKKSLDSKCYLLALPVRIRRQIYYEAGLGPGLFIDMNYWSALTRKRPMTGETLLEFDAEIERLDNQAFNDERIDRRLPSFPLSLLLACHQLHDEVERILYSENRFAITRRDPGGFRALERISATALQELRFLTIRLNVSSCVQKCCDSHLFRCDNIYGYCKGQSEHDPPLGDKSRSDKQTLSQWQQIYIPRLAANNYTTRSAYNLRNL